MDKFNFVMTAKEIPSGGGGQEIAPEMTKLLEQIRSLPADKMLRFEAPTENSRIVDAIRYHIRAKKLPARLIERGKVIVIVRTDGWGPSSL